LQQVYNEFRRFGEIKNADYMEKDNTLFIEYDDYVSLKNAYEGHNPKVDGDNIIKVELARSNEVNKLNLDFKERDNEYKPDIPSNSVSYYWKLVDIVFNW
jgi:RNA recognition motif-containing protein